MKVYAWPVMVTTVVIAFSGVGAERVSVASGGAQGNDASYSYGASISGDGRYVVFTSAASSLVPGDTNGVLDVFVRDRRSGRTSRVSVAGDGTQADGASYLASISADGRYVVFNSEATDLVPGDTNGVQDVFVRDRWAGSTRRVSVAEDGRQGNAPSASYGASISADGRYVAFWSAASNLVPGDTNDTGDVFVRDLRIGTTVRVSVGPDGVQANGFSQRNLAISADGRYVAFNSDASNLVSGDTNGLLDVFVRDLRAGVTERISVASDGTQADGISFPYSVAINADGRYVAFASAATNLVPGDTNQRWDVFVRDRRAGTTERVNLTPEGTQADGSSYYVALDAAGRYVGFDSDATNLVPGDTNHATDMFVRDRWSRVTTRISVAGDGTQANGSSFWGIALDASGRDAVFNSDATNLVPGDTNGVQDVFVRHRPG